MRDLHPGGPPRTTRTPTPALLITVGALATALALLFAAPAEASFGFITQWGSAGSGNGQLNSPLGVATDSQGNVYVADTFNNRIQVFGSSGAFITKWGSFGSGNGQLSTPLGVATDAQGNVYVADANNNRIEKFDSSGAFITQWGSFGSGDGQFNSPRSVATDAQGNVYVADTNNNRIEKFDSSGAFITQWGSFGSGDGQFNSPRSVATDAQGNVYVADTNNNRIEKFDSSGAFITQWGSAGSGDGQFNFAVGVATDSHGNVYVSETYPNDRIQVFGEQTPTLAELIASVDALGLPHGIEVSLEAKLREAQGNLDQGETGDACEQLASFVAELEALRGKKIASTSVDELIANAQAISKSLGCASRSRASAEAHRSRGGLGDRGGWPPDRRARAGIGSR